MTAVAANGITIEYESLGDPSAPPILLIMGLGMQLVAWPDAFCQGLVDRGFRVIRFDNRDCGLSSKIRVRRQPNLVAALAAAWLRLPVRAPYTLDAMAADAVGLLDALDIPRAHVVGLSMGGMIAQVVAATYPERVLSLTSIMSSSGSRKVSQPRPDAKRALLSKPRDPDDPESVVDHLVGVFGVIGSPGFPTDRAALREQRRAQRAPRPPSGGHDAAAGRDHRVRRPPQAAAEDHRADARHPRRGGSAGAGRGGPGHRAPHRGREADGDRGHGPRSRAGPRADPGRGDRRALPRQRETIENAA